MSDGTSSQVLDLDEFGKIKDGSPDPRIFCPPSSVCCHGKAKPNDGDGMLFKLNTGG